MKKVSKVAKIRAALSAGQKPKDVAKNLKVSISSVYTENWKMRQENKVKTTANKLPPMPKFQPKPDPAFDFLRDELASVERQIDTLNTVASFLAIRLRQMEQNA